VVVNLLLQAAALRGSLPVPPPELLPAVEPLPRYEYRSELYQRDGFGRQVEDGASTTLAALSVVKFGLSMSGLGLDGMLTTGLVPQSTPALTTAASAEGLAMQGRPVVPTPKSYEQALDPELWLNAVARKYNINLRGAGGTPITVKYDPALKVEGITLWDEGGRVIRIGPRGMVDEATAANTLAHEVSHGRDIIRAQQAGITSMKEANRLGFLKPHGDSLSVGDGTPYGSGNALESFIRGER
jgi:hypothetical protein